MSREATTTLSVGAPETHSEQTSERLSLPQKLAARGRAVLNNFNGLPMTKLPEAISAPTDEPEVGSPAWLENKFNQPSHTPAHEVADEVEPVHTEKVRRGFGSRILAHINLSIVQAYGAPEAIRAKEQAWHDSERFQKKETDSRLRRISKFLGRNAIRSAAGVMALAGVGAYAAHMAHVTDMGVRHVSMDVQNMPYETVAKTSFYIGGRGDGTASQYIDYAKHTGTYDPTAINKTANYSASIGPVDAERMDVSTNVAADQMVQAYHEANGAPFEVHAFSEGTVAAIDGLKKLEAQGVDMSNVTIYVDGGPRGIMGEYNSPYVHAVSPVLSSLGIDPSTDIPKGTKVVVRTYSGDMWGNGGNQSGVTQAAMLGTLGTNHRPIENGAILINERVVDGITYQEFAYPDGLTNPISEALSANGAYVSPAGDRLIDSFVPVTHLGENTQYADANEVKGATADFISDTILRNNGVDASPIVNDVTNAVMTPKRTQDAQNMLDLTRIPDQATAIVNDPASAPQNLNAIHNEIQNGAQTVGEYLKPNTWVDAINDGIKGAGIQGFQLPHFQDTPAPAPVAPAPAPAPADNPIAQFQQGLNLFGQNLQQNLANFGKQR